MLVDQHVVEKHLQTLPSDVHRCAHVLVESFRWRRELLAEDVENTLAANEADEVIVAGFWLGQGVTRGLVGLWKTQGDPRRGQGSRGRLAAQRAVAIQRVVALFEERA